jgi:hypothetical protein
MPGDIPHVQVVQDPLVVYLFVALFALAIVLACAFAFIGRRVDGPQPNSNGGDITSGERSVTIGPWSTASPESAGPGPKAPGASG